MDCPGSDGEEGTERDGAGQGAGRGASPQRKGGFFMTPQDSTAVPSSDLRLPPAVVDQQQLVPFGAIHPGHASSGNGSFNPFNYGSGALDLRSSLGSDPQVSRGPLWPEAASITAAMHRGEVVGGAKETIVTRTLHPSPSTTIQSQLTFMRSQHGHMGGSATGDAHLNGHTGETCANLLHSPGCRRGRIGLLVHTNQKTL